jgi:hypothetical protein
MHFGISPQKAADEFIRLLRYGLLPRPEESRRLQAYQPTRREG